MPQMWWPEFTSSYTFFTYRHIHNTTHRCSLVFTDVLISCISAVKKEKYQVIYIKIHHLWYICLHCHIKFKMRFPSVSDHWWRFFCNEDYSTNLFLDGDKTSVTLSKQVPLHSKQWKELTYCSCFLVSTASSPIVWKILKGKLFQGLLKVLDINLKEKKKVLFTWLLFILLSHLFYRRLILKTLKLYT